MYSTFVKQILMDSIHELSQTPENYAVYPDTDFTRNRKIGFKDFLLLLLTMEDDCLREELFGEKLEAKSEFLLTFIKVTLK
ncbi:MAG: hypothetical protein MR409_09945 [Lachnospiraceae bacterium]|nr:hypothetical protein [Lachnospiraceae bacterium]